MKRIFSLLLAIVLVFATMIPVAATETENTISPRFTYIDRVSTGLAISSSGIASCTATGITFTASSAKLVCRLQQYKNGTWTTIKSWTDTGTPSTSIANSYAVYSGYKYRTYTSFYVYNSSGSLLESTACYSSTRTY